MIWKKTLKTLLLLAALGVVIVGITLWEDAQPPSVAPDFPHAWLSVQRADGKNFSYSVEVATTREQEMYGLMFRKTLPADAGMIFIYDPDQPVSMWMKNTFIPLDMLYVRHNGTIAKILTHAQPEDLTPLPSGEPVHGVIELNAGDVEKNGFKTGDKIVFSGFGK